MKQPIILADDNFCSMLKFIFKREREERERERERECVRSLFKCEKRHERKLTISKKYLIRKLLKIWLRMAHMLNTVLSTFLKSSRC